MAKPQPANAGTAASFLSDVQDAAAARAAAHRGRRGDVQLWRRRETGVQGPERRAGDRNRVRAALQAALLHGHGDRFGFGQGRIPGARQRGTGARRCDCQPDRPARRRAESQSRGHGIARPLGVCRGQDAARHDPRGPGRRTGRHRELSRDHRVARWQGLDDAQDARRHPGRRRGTCRGHELAADWD